jgi:hypothetical protein
MIRSAMQMKSWFARVTVIAFIALAATAAHADIWRGTAPFCDGQCRAGEREIRRSDCGDGACCVTGSKVLCDNDGPTCTPRQTRTSCAGVVMICDKGFFELGPEPPRWISCSKFACGLCFGFDF